MNDPARKRKILAKNMRPFGNGEASEKHNLKREVLKKEVIGIMNLLFDQDYAMRLYSLEQAK